MSRMSSTATGLREIIADVVCGLQDRIARSEDVIAAQGRELQNLKEAASERARFRETEIRSLRAQLSAATNSILSKKSAEAQQQHQRNERYAEVLKQIADLREKVGYLKASVMQHTQTIGAVQRDRDVMAAAVDTVIKDVRALKVDSHQVYDWGPTIDEKIAATRRTLKGRNTLLPRRGYQDDEESSNRTPI